MRMTSVSMMLCAATSAAWPETAVSQCAPEVAHRTELAPVDFHYAAEALVVGDHLYVGLAGGQLHVLDISDRMVPVREGELPVSTYDLVAHGSLVVVTGGTYLHTLEVSDPAAPRLLASWPTGQIAFGVALSQDGSLAFLVTMDRTLMVVDISDPALPQLIGRLVTVGEPWRIAAEGDHVYIAARSGGVRVIDVSDPTQPVAVGSFDTGTDAFAITVRDGLAWIGSFDAGLMVLDVSDPAAPVELARMEEPIAVTTILLESNLVWALGGGDGFASAGAELLILDGSDPRNPVIIGRTRMHAHEPQFNLALAVDSGFAYVADNHEEERRYFVHASTVDLSSCVLCYPDCDASGSLDFFDFLCFQNLFAAGDPAADCDGSGELDLFDFLCFQNQFAEGCP